MLYRNINNKPAKWKTKPPLKSLPTRFGPSTVGYCRSGAECSKYRQGMQTLASRPAEMNDLDRCFTVQSCPCFNHKQVQRCSKRQRKIFALCKLRVLIRLKLLRVTGTQKVVSTMYLDVLNVTSTPYKRGEAFACLLCTSPFCPPVINFPVG